MKKWGILTSLLLVLLVVKAPQFAQGLVPVSREAPTGTPTPLVLGIDHLPVVVTDLEKAQADFQAMGFAIKPGRFHADGIRNAHVKFPDGTEIELITAPKAVDELTSEYRAKMAKGEGPVYFGLYSTDTAAVRARLNALRVGVQDDEGMLTFPQTSPLHPLFLGKRNKAPTDLPEHFAHQNSAVRLSALWVRDNPDLRGVLKGLGVPLTSAGSCGFIGVTSAIRATLPEGDLYLVPSGTTTVVEVQRLSDVETVLKTNGISLKKDTACDGDALWVPPSRAHGIWIEFAGPRVPEPTSATW
jgi:hypothetical protein